MSADTELAIQLRERADQLQADCPDTVVRTLRATGEQMSIACTLCRESAARFEFVAHLLDKPLHRRVSGT